MDAPAVITVISGLSQSMRIIGISSWRTNSMKPRVIAARYRAIAVLAKHRLAGHAVAGVDLRPPRLEILPHRVDEPHALDLLGIAAGGGKHDDRLAEMAPPRNGHIALERVRIPALSPLHGRTVSRIGHGPAHHARIDEACLAGEQPAEPIEEPVAPVDPVVAVERFDNSQLVGHLPAAPRPSRGPAPRAARMLRRS